MSFEKESIRVAVIGSRGITAVDLSKHLPVNCCLIVSGGAKGIDTIAEQYAKEHGIETLIIRPDYEKFGRGAPIHRNKIIVENADLILAFWDEVSRGTKSTIDYAKKIGKPVSIIIPEKISPAPQLINPSLHGC